MMNRTAPSIPAITWPALHASWPLIVGALLFALLIQRPELLNDPDIMWHIKVGEHMLATGEVLRSDHLSHTMAGAPWLAHEWLSEVLYASAFRLGGWTAVVACASAAFAAAIALLLRYLLRYLEPIYGLAIAALAGLLLAPHLVARPHTLMAPLLVMWAIGLVAARDADRPPPFWLLPVMALWANLHGSFVFGLCFLGVVAADAIWGSWKHRQLRVCGRWAVFVAAAVGASMLTPFGAKALGFAFTVNDMTFTLGQIGEWRSPDFQKLQPLEVCLLLTSAGVLYFGLRLSALRIVLLLGLLHLALKHVRHADLVALIAPILLAKPVAEQWFLDRIRANPPSRMDEWFLRLAPPASAGATIVVVMALAGAGLAAIQKDGLRPSAALSPESALRSLKESDAAGKGLNSYDFGGFLIFSGIPTFVDGRADLYGDKFLRDYFDALNLSGGSGFAGFLKAHDIRWTMLQPGVPAVQLLDHLAGWRRLHSDRFAVVHVRDG